MFARSTRLKAALKAAAPTVPVSVHTKDKKRGTVRVKTSRTTVNGKIVTPYVTANEIKAANRQVNGDVEVEIVQTVTHIQKPRRKK